MNIEIDNLKQSQLIQTQTLSVQRRIELIDDIEQLRNIALHYCNKCYELYEKQEQRMNDTKTPKNNQATQRDVQLLENELSFQKAKYLQLQNQVKEERENIERRESLFTFQKKQLVEKATQQSLAVIQKQQQELQDKQEVLNLFNKKVQERDKQLSVIQKENELIKDQLEKLRKKVKKMPKKKKNPIPRPLSAIGSPAPQPPNTEETDEDEISINCEPLDIEQLQDIVEPEQQPLSYPEEDYEFFIIDQYAPPDLSDLLQKQLRMPIQLIGYISENPLKIQFKTKVLMRKTYQILRELNVNLKSDTVKTVLTNLKLSEITEEMDDKPEILFAKEVENGVQMEVEEK
ncbi:Cast_domain containing protein [Hexamita inflata]|uniref:Cast domain containing protein n=1 Tax=Hexamita inflata TaxID=28002 RepID=A0AA86NBH8_9EUKA|nr:Cast domain containing protein [Hexamita inflata]